MRPQAKKQGKKMSIEVRINTNKTKVSVTEGTRLTEERIKESKEEEETVKERSQEEFKVSILSPKLREDKQLLENLEYILKESSQHKIEVKVLPSPVHKKTRSFFVKISEFTQHKLLVMTQAKFDKDSRAIVKDFSVNNIPTKAAKKIKLTPMKLQNIVSSRISTFRAQDISVMKKRYVPKPVTVNELIVSKREGEESLYAKYGDIAIPDCLVEEEFLNESYKEERGFGNIVSGRPVIILVDTHRGFHELIKRLCIKLYRIKCNVEPSLDEDIITLRLSLSDIDMLARNIYRGDPESPLKKFEESLEKMAYSERLKFMIISVKSEEFHSVYDSLKSTKLPLEIKRLIVSCKLLAYKFKPRSEEFLEKLLLVAFGFASPKSIHGTDIGSIVAELDKEFYEELNETKRWVESKIKSIHEPFPGGELGAKESWLHYLLKYLVYRHLIKNEEIDEKVIKCESNVKGIKKVADVYVEPIRRAIEIETMFGTGDPINAKIRRHTVNQYYKDRFKGELWLVVPNLHALFYTRSLLRLREDYRKEGLDLEIYITDVTGQGARYIYNEERDPGLIKFVDALKFIKEGTIDIL